MKEDEWMKIKGVNLGNWLVLEKWMSPALFDGTTAEDEYYLPTQLSPEVYEARIKIHRSEYITERYFATIKRIGLNTVGRSFRISEDAAMQDWEAVTALF